MRYSKKLNLILMAGVGVLLCYLLSVRMLCFAEGFDEQRIAEILFEEYELGYKSSDDLRAHGLQVLRSDANIPWGYSASVYVFIRDESEHQGGKVEQFIFSATPCGRIKNVYTSTQDQLIWDSDGAFATRRASLE